MIDGYMIFSYNEHAKKWIYGATPAQMLSHDIVLITPENFVAALLQTPNLSTKIPEIVKQVRAHEDVDHKELRKAPEMLKKLKATDKMIQDNAIFVHPQPMSQDRQIHELRRWGPLMSENIRDTIGEWETCVAFTLSRSEALPPCPPNRRFRWHNFMQSRVFLVLKPKDA
jgi:hypothetical protein